MKKMMDQKLLEGVKIFDFGWALAGGYTTKLLGDYGATVVKAESSVHIDFARTNRMVSVSSRTNPDDKPFYSYYNTSKLGLSINLKHPRAKEVIARFYRWADVVFENFSPGKLDELGFGYEFAKSIKPDIIMCHVSIYGQSGRMSNQPGTDGTGSSAAAHRLLTGWPDRYPVPPSNIFYGDMLVPLFAVTSIVAALDYRRRTGKGQEIDCSMFEALAQKAAPTVVDLAGNGNLQSRSGNRVAYAAPHGAYPCRGEDRWCAIAVYSDEDWKALCEAMGNPDWCRDPRFDTLEGRKGSEDVIDEEISRWTREWEADRLMEYLQSRGIAAGVIQTAGDLVDADPVLRERNYLAPVDHPVLGPFRHPRPPFLLSGHEPSMAPSPGLGEHTFHVCTEILGMTDEEFIELDQAGVFV